MPLLLVTGGAGFIGAAVVEQALGAGWDVRVLDSASAPGPGSAGATFERGDVRDAEVLARAMRGVGAVCHLAAKVGLGVDFADAPDYASRNVVGTAEVLAAMAERGIRRLVIASSMVVYGEGAYRDRSGALRRPAPRRVEDLERGEFEPRDVVTGEVLVPDLLDEEATLDPRNVYAATKLAQEHLASSWARETGAAAAMLRFHNVYGARMPRDTPYAGVAALFRSELAHGRPPRVFEDGSQRRDFVHVSDVAGANMAALAWTTAQGGGARAFNVGSGVVTTIGHLAERLASAMDGPAPVVTGDYRLGDVRHITASSERAARELGWRARIDLDAGLREFASGA